MKQFIVSFVLVSAVCSVLTAAQETIPDLVRRTGGRVERKVIVEYPPADLSQLVKTTDLIARVLVLDGFTRLSLDEREAETDYTVLVLDSYLSRGVTKAGEKLTVTRRSGTMMIEGLSFTAYESEFSPFEPNEEYVLFLRFDPKANRFTLPHGPQSAFRVVGGYVEQMLLDGEWNRERGRLPLLQFVEEVSRTLGR